MASLGEELKRERELRSISLQDIAAQTKIGLRYLQALESDRLDILPGKFLTKAILRSYAQALGTDESAILNKYHQEIQVQEKAGRVQERERPLPPISEPRKRPSRAVLGLGLFGGSAATLAVLYALVLAPRGTLRPAAPGPPRPAAAMTSVPAVTTSAPAAESPAGFPQLPPVVAPAPPETAESLRLEIEFEAETWIHIAADGAVLETGIYRAGTRAAWEAKTEFVLQTGNAGGFRWRINGRTARPLGPLGAVLTDIRIRRDNLKTYLEPGG